MRLFDFRQAAARLLMPLQVIKRVTTIDRELGQSIETYDDATSIMSVAPQPSKMEVVDDISGEVVSGSYELFTPDKLDYDNIIIFNGQRFRVIAVQNFMINGGYYRIYVIKVQDDS